MDTALSHTSTTLLDGVAAANPLAERTFVDRYSRLARGVAHTREVHPDDLEDLVQEFVIAAVYAVREGRYDRRRGHFKHYLMGVLFHKIAHVRSAAARSAIMGMGVGGDALKDIADPAPSPDEEFESAFEAEWQKALFDEAAEIVRQRIVQRGESVNWQAYDLVVNGGWKPRAVARLLGIRRSQVDNAKSRILAAIRAAVQELTHE